MQSPQPLNSQRRKTKGLRGLILSVLLVSAIFIVWLNRQYIADSISFWQFQPSSQVNEITQNAGLTDTGKFTFYAAQPVVASGKSYNDKCNQQEEQAAILGCYTNNRIYIYDVTDPRLSGIKEVTSAHEMLHAVYQRLSPDEKAAIDRLLESEFETLKNDPSYSERMAYYERTEPGQRDNELHSIIGTEIENINPELQKHYAKYFNDRSKIVSMYKAYNKVFVELEDKRKQLSIQLDSLSAQIEKETDRYSSDTQLLSRDIDTFNRKSLSGDFTSQTQFNSERQALVSRSNVLSNQRASINAMVARFNSLKDEYNETVTQSNDLYRSMDSSLTPAPKV